MRSESRFPLVSLLVGSEERRSRVAEAVPVARPSTLVPPLVRRRPSTLEVIARSRREEGAVVPIPTKPEEVSVRLRYVV